MLCSTSSCETKRVQEDVQVMTTRRGSTINRAFRGCGFYVIIPCHLVSLSESKCEFWKLISCFVMEGGVGSFTNFTKGYWEMVGGLIDVLVRVYVCMYVQYIWRTWDLVWGNRVALRRRPHQYCPILSLSLSSCSHNTSVERLPSLTSSLKGSQRVTLSSASLDG